MNETYGIIFYGAVQHKNMTDDSVRRIEQFVKCLMVPR
ncbi:MAG: hypothetical protein JWO15_2147 [Sphingomonadales bacterium]|nr:hypothetical protein [Sphingomonadales bacterium]